jgi:hypothetical protein
MQESREAAAFDRSASCLWIVLFDSVVAPPAGLEPATGSLTRWLVPLIEGTIDLPSFRCLRPIRSEGRWVTSPRCNLALVAFAV